MPNGAEKFRHNGYEYRPWTDWDDDVSKIFHDVYFRDSDLLLEVNSVPMSPYNFLTLEAFTKWIDCGLPGRQDMGLSGNCNNLDIYNYYNKWLDDKIDQELLGVTK